MIRPIASLCFMEVGTYLFHRALHELDAPWHARHHAHPHDRRTAAVDGAIGAVAGLAAASAALRVGGQRLCGRTMVAYAFGVPVVHAADLDHALPDATPGLQSFRTRHETHHFHYGGVNYGALSAVPDWICGTDDSSLRKLGIR